ncbi:hypothetical protein V492_00220, partial [Pseudogymnoascus sp. VKM F-4246]
MTSARPSGDDLWASAAANLSEEDRCNISFGHPDKLGVLSDLLTLTEKSRQECISKRWRYTRKSGETVIFRDLFGKIVKSIDLFKQVGDVAVQYDPVHAALPWAGVRFLLQIAVNDHATYATLIEGAALMAEMICRYAVFEDLYLRSTSLATDELKRALIQLYAAIMIYLSKAKRYFDQNSAKRIIKSGVLNAPDLESSLDSITTAQVAVDHCSGLVSMQDDVERHKELKRILKHIDAPLKRFEEDFKKVQDNLEASRRTKILCWVSPEPYSQHHQQAWKDVLSGTGNWLLSDLVFDKWKKESVSSILWLHGIPGSGKTKLASIVIEDAMQAFRAGQSPPPAFFYCSRNTAEPARSNPDAIIASIVRQLSCLQPDFPLLGPVVATYRKREAEGFASGPLRIDESTALIIQLTEQYPMTTIVIDALDECDPETRTDLLETLEKILKESSRLVKIFVSSRDDQDIVCHLEDYPNLGISSDRNMDDITSFVRVETQDLIKKKKLLRSSTNKEELKEMIIDQVTKGANGMFRWASLQLQSLSEQKSDEAIRERIGRLPAKLEDLYMELYEKFTKYEAEADRQITRIALSWLLCAQRTLKSTEFLAALSITLGRPSSSLTKEAVLDMCCNLVTFDASLDTFRFAHLSVREFLEKQPDYKSTIVNTLAAETCLLELISVGNDTATKRFLSQQRQLLPRTSPILNDFSTYPALYWATHCQLAAGERTQDVLKGLIPFFLSCESDPASPLAVWTSRIQNLLVDDLLVDGIEGQLFHRLHDTIAASAIPLFIACSFDFPELVPNQISRGILQANFVNSQRLTALHVAVKHSSCGAILALITNGFIEITENVVEAATGNERSGKEVVTLLLDQRGDDVRITDNVVKAAARNRGDDVHITDDVVKAAAGNMQSGKEVIALLLDRRGDNVHITDDVVKAAALNGGSGKEVMALLLDQRGDDVRITEDVLKAAAWNRESGKEVMTLLLDRRGVDVHITDDLIKAAAENALSGKEVMTLLLDRRGDNVHITDDVVKAAALNGGSGKEVMALLLDQRGDDVRITEDVLKAAAWNRGSGKEVITLLLDRRGDDVHITDDVVKAAAGNMQSGKEVIALLLDRRGDDVHITDDVVKAAAGNVRSGKEVMALLLDRRGDDVHITDNVVKAAAGNER